MKGMAMLAAAILLASTAQADEPGTRKAGEWKVMMLGPDGQPRAPHIFCFAAGPIDDITKRMDSCSKRDVSKTGDVTVVDAICTKGQHQIEMHMSITAPTEDAYTADMHVTYTPSMGGVSDLNMTTQGEFQGPCAPNVKPAN
jgi:hypothetical protein